MKRSTGRLLVIALAAIVAFGALETNQLTRQSLTDITI